MHRFRASLVETSSSLRNDSTDILDHVSEISSRIKQTEPVVHALVEEQNRDARLLREAKLLKDTHPEPTSRPLLYGVLVGVKDLFNVDGFATQAGSQLPSDIFNGPQASIVSRIRDLGGVIVGKTAMDEFAYADPSPTRNPHNPEHTPGGSSSGSAAAVATGISPLCIGTQTSRSVIAPASFCGVVGFKPTYGRVPIDGAVLMSPSLDTVGFFTQDVQSMAFAAAAFIPEWEDSASGGRPVLGIPEGTFMTYMSDDMKMAFSHQVSNLKAAGYNVESVQMPWDHEIDEIYQSTMTLLHGEMFRIHSQWVTKYHSLYRSRTAEGIELGRQVTDEDLEFCRATQRRLRKDIMRWMDHYGIDLWITPSQGATAPKGDAPTGWGGMTIPWSFAGLPCLSIPAGTINDLPYGIQCVARFGQDEALVDWVVDIAKVLRTGGPAGPDSIAPLRRCPPHASQAVGS
jgi:Asp-tRNA(Asn)/Glu-tRNA(Gln) amidotransferase A subunit family amidase